MEAERKTDVQPESLKKPDKLNVEVQSTDLRHLREWALGYSSTCFYA
jgi:hypothetical protein